MPSGAGPGQGLAENTAVRSWRLKSGGEHCRPELAVEVRRGTRGLAGNTAIRSWLVRSGGEHCHPTLAVEEAEEERRSAAADIKSDNPRLTGGEKQACHKFR